MSPLDLASVAGDVSELYEPAGRRKEASSLTLFQPPASPMIEGKRSLVAQALANLVDNAIKYTPPGGKVAISHQPELRRAWISRWPTAVPAFPAA